MILLLLFLLFPSALFAAQTFTIPQGTTVYGPIPASKANKYSTIAIDRTLWTNPAITLQAFVEFTSNGTTWIKICEFTGQGGKITGEPLTFAGCVFPPTTTQIRATAIVKGGSISMPKPPTFGVK